MNTREDVSRGLDRQDGTLTLVMPRLKRKENRSRGAII